MDPEGVALVASPWALGGAGPRGPRRSRPAYLRSRV